MAYISAPYNFVPLSERIFIPSWGQDVSHDIPFQDGFSGELHYTLVAHTPLLVGGRQAKADKERPGEVKPFQLPDGRYALPGSSLKGLLRSVVEIAGFGRMGKVDEVRPGLRDISKANTVYAQRVRDKVHTGFLRRRDDGSHEIVPCLMVRLHHRSLETALGVPAPIFAARQSVGKKYETWQRLCAERQIDPAQIRFELGQPDAARLFQGSLVGTPVFTGQISDSTKDKGKQRDFIFYSPRPQQAIAVPPSAWRDFLRIHGDEDGKADMSWPGYWKAQYRAGREVPVFYLQDGGLLRIGLAYMPKLAGDFSTYDMICHANPGHLHAPGAAHGYDLADLLFGAINGENQADALRGRVSFETAVAQGKPQPTKHGPTILNGPKPSYFPNYITQPGADPNTWRLRNGQPYATYIQTGSSKAPTLRGFKRYPVRPDAKVQPLTDEQSDNKKVQIVLHTLPPQTRFDGRIVFHNLKPEELGALLWALTWGDDSAKRHSLGMGKPFGFGQAHVELNAARCRLIPNDPAQPETPLSDERRAQLLRQFGQQMNAAVPDWERSPQMLNLLAMADPGAAKQLPRGMELRHMKLEAKQRINEFQVAKQAQHVLADYAVATGAQNAGDWRPTQGKAHAECSRPGAAAAASPGNPKSPEPSAVSEQKTVWNNARLTWNKGSQTLEAVAPDGKRAQETRDTAKKLIAALPPEQGQRLDKKGELKGVTVEVKGMGNRFVIQRLIKGAG
ncbi:MAG: TIGR03986 family CRISPR-associated RAMP protein [Thiomonas sp.]|uniref:TIGR03986 family type III CRISPR-associated RAMP protein n=1 Tax=Thiomonas sp. TaxID=2047785 RepID=UPI002A35F328|nr:TIGR03986 family CRISPR-associated RAMP protein [Thiomonas sp.]MDY0331153.1 TIGR03986 family CRISPR-associated RAMP protein [Thiomonas sp.]